MSLTHVIVISFIYIYIYIRNSFMSSYIFNFINLELPFKSIAKINHRREEAIKQSGLCQAVRGLALNREFNLNIYIYI